MAGISEFTSREGVPSLGLFQPDGGGLADSPSSLAYPYGRKSRSASFFGSAEYDMTSWLQVGIDATAGRTVNNTGFSVFQGNLTLPAASGLNPFGQAVNVTLDETAPALGEDYDEAHIDYYSAVLGLLAKMRGGWQASLDTQYGLSVTTYRGISGVDNARWQRLVDSGTYNPLRDTGAFGPPQPFYDQVLEFYGSRGSFVTLGDYDTLDTAFRLTNSTLMLPTGVSTVNVGGDYRFARLESFVDALRYGDGTLVAPPEHVGRPLAAAGELLCRASIPAPAPGVASQLDPQCRDGPRCPLHGIQPRERGQLRADRGHQIRFCRRAFPARHLRDLEHILAAQFSARLQAAQIGKSGSGPTAPVTSITDPRRRGGAI